MRLARIVIKNFRRIAQADIVLEPASFVIGQNNLGKSSVIRAIDALLGAAVTGQDFRQDETGTYLTEIELIGYFTGIDPTTAAARGFKGRVVNGEYRYRKTYGLATPTKPKIECLEYPYSIKAPYIDARTGQDLVDCGLQADDVKKLVAGGDLSKRLKADWERELLDDVVEFDTTAEPTWRANPGGFPAIVQSKLPRVLHVKALTEEGELGKADKDTLVSEVLNILFEDLLEGNEIADALTDSLERLQQQMSPETEGSLISALRMDINEIIGSVFPGCGIDVKPSLTQGLSAVLKPKYEIKLFSNVKTDVGQQGTGLLRTAIFSMLRYHARLRTAKEHTRPLLVAFEEPEMYLHPAAANLLRDTIYELGASDQIVCTTHSPWMIDLSRNLQSLTKMVTTDEGAVTAINYGVSQQLLNLNAGDRDRVKMLQLFDDEMSRVFFTDRVVVVEGDSELVAIKQTLKHLPDDSRKSIISRTQVVKARGKASILSVVKYLQALAIKPVVIHDRDQGTAGAEVFNLPIAQAVGDPDRVIVLQECIEDALGYSAPSSDKPYKVFQVASKWTGLNDIPDQWLTAFKKAFDWSPS